MKKSRRALHITVMPDYKPGDPPPEGYLEWHEWADVQRKAGIKQTQCCICMLWRTPQELSGQMRKWSAVRRNGQRVEMESPVCLKCAAKTESVQGTAR